MLMEKSKIEVINNLILGMEPNQFKGLTTKIKSIYPDIFKELKDIKNKLNLTSISECIYLVTNNMDCVPKCTGLSDECTHDLKFKSLIEGYTKYCKHCCCLSEEFKEKREETNLEKYGSKYPTQSNEIKKKIIETNIKKYGVNNVKKINVPLIKKFKLSKIKFNRKNKLNLNFSIGQR